MASKEPTIRVDKTTSAKPSAGSYHRGDLPSAAAGNPCICNFEDLCFLGTKETTINFLTERGMLRASQ